MKTEQQAHEEWVAFGFPETIKSIEHPEALARHVVEQFADHDEATVIETAPIRASSSPMNAYAKTRFSGAHQTIVYDKQLTHRHPCMIVGSLVHELFHVLIWEMLYGATDVHPNKLTDEEHEVLTVTAENLCLFPGVADLNFDAMSEAWSVRVSSMDASLSAAAHALAVSARVEVLDKYHTSAMRPDQARQVLMQAIRQLLQGRGYTDGT